MKTKTPIFNQDITLLGPQRCGGSSLRHDPIKAPLLYCFLNTYQHFVCFIKFVALILPPFATLYLKHGLRLQSSLGCSLWSQELFCIPE